MNTLFNVTNQGLKIVVSYDPKFTEAQIEKHRTACHLLETVLNSRDFYNRMMEVELIQNNGKTNQQIYEMIMTGAENLSPDEDHEMDIFVVPYYANTSTVGYTNESTPKTWINLKFFNQYNYSEIACNIFHEWLHKIGFDHDKRYSLARNSSVPYALGYLVEAMIEELLGGTVLAPVKPIGSKRTLVCTRSWRTFFLKRCYYVYG